MESITVSTYFYFIFKIMFQDVYIMDFYFLVGLVYGCVLHLFDVILFSLYPSHSRLKH